MCSPMPGTQRSVSASSMRTSQRLRAAGAHVEPAGQRGDQRAGMQRPGGRGREPAPVCRGMHSSGCVERQRKARDERRPRRGGPVHQSPRDADARPWRPTGAACRAATWVWASGQQRACACEGSARMPVISAKARSSLASTRAASSRRCSCDQAGAGLQGPALDALAPGLGGFARQPGHAVVGAARGVPLRAEVGQVGLVGLREGDHQRPARRDAHRLDALADVGGQLAVAEQGARAGRRHRQQHAVEARIHVLRIVGARGAQLPALVVERIALDARDAGSASRAHRPAARPSARPAHPCRAARPSAARARAGRLRPRGRARRARAPRLALQGLHSCGAVSSARAKRGSRTVKYCAPLSKLPKGVRFARHAAAGGGFAFEHGHAVAGLHQRAGAGHARHAGADDGVVARGAGSMAVGDGAGGGHGQSRLSGAGMMGETLNRVRMSVALGGAPAARGGVPSCSNCSSHH